MNNSLFNNSALSALSEEEMVTIFGGEEEGGGEKTIVKPSAPAPGSFSNANGPGNTISVVSTTATITMSK